jgi:hypothetical protein
MFSLSVDMTDSDKKAHLGYYLSMRFLRSFVAVLAFAMVMPVASVAAQGKSTPWATITVQEVPMTVSTAYKRRFTRGGVKKAELQTKNGVVRYRITVRNGKHANEKIIILASGEIVQ